METQIILLLLIKIVTVMVMGAICALFSYFLDYCFWNGSIFENYLPWLSKSLVRWRRPEDYAEALMLDKIDQEQELLDRAAKIFLFKVLGGCIVCTNVYIATISFTGIQIASSSYGITFCWWFSIPYVMTSSVILRKLLKH